MAAAVRVGRPSKSKQKQKLDTLKSCEVVGLRAVFYLRIVNVANVQICPKLDMNSWCRIFHIIRFSRISTLK